MNKHTPGPWTLELVDTSIGTCWKIGPFPSAGVHKETHACVYANNILRSDLGANKTGDELAANARLIAAAPDLLAALRILLPLLDRDHPAATQEEINRCDVCFCVAKARAAIAKATSPSRASEAKGSMGGGA